MPPLVTSTAAADDFVMFFKSANLSTNASTFTTGTGSIASYNNSTGITTTNWTSTCSNATELVVADLNGDTYDDVINYAPADDLLCLHFVNSTTGVGFDPSDSRRDPCIVHHARRFW